MLITQRISVKQISSKRGVENEIVKISAIIDVDNYVRSKKTMSRNDYHNERNFLHHQVRSMMCVPFSVPLLEWMQNY